MKSFKENICSFNPGKIFFITFLSFSLLNSRPPICNEDFLQREPIQKEEIVLNNSQEFYTYCFQTQPEGLKRLVELSKQSDYEDAWIFIPEEKLWVEIGLESKVSPGKRTVSLDRDLLDKYLREYNSVAIYHTHPVFENLPEREKRRVAITPTFNDLASSIFTSEKFHKNHSYGSITHGICSPYGVTEYYLKDKDKLKIDDVISEHKEMIDFFYQVSYRDEDIMFFHSTPSFELRHFDYTKYKKYP
ncbi:MAG: hypothetical protein ACOC1P_05605 [Minisyncoccales bacterium]